MRRSEHRKTASKENADKLFRDALRLWTYGSTASKEQRAAAIERYTLAAKKGNAKAQIVLGEILCDPDYEDTFDFAAGYKWIIRAADQGDIGAQSWIGRELATGEHVRRRPVEAAKWYRKAARRGHPSAQYNLAMMYVEGDGVPRNWRRARDWILRAAKSGEILAQMLLGDAYATGELGFPILPATAKRWRDRAKRSLSGKQR